MTNPLVLVADDDPLLLSLLEIRLKNAGFGVALAKDGVCALEMFARCRPQVAVLDAMMPRMGGFEMLRHIRSRATSSEVRVVMLTALKHEDDIVGALRQGADDYLVKPFSPSELIARIERWRMEKAA